MNLSKSTKQQIIEHAKQYVQHHSLSQDAFSEHVKKVCGGQGVNVAYINDLFKGKMTTGVQQTAIDDKYFLRIAKATNLQIRKTYDFHHELDNYLMIMNALSDARDTGLPVAIDGNTGDGKSYTAQDYLRQHPKNTYIVRCDGDLTAKSFFTEMAYSLGMTPSGPVYDIRKNVIQKLKNEETPLLIIDESENLKDRAWESLKRIMDDLKGHCGIAFIGANEFERMLQKKADKLKGCFPQVLRRIREGGFTKLLRMNLDDVALICKPYGVGKVSLQKALFERCKNVGELTALLKRIMREHDSTHNSVDELIELYCNVERKMKAA